MFERIAASFALARSSWNVLVSEKKLLIFPALSGLGCTLVTLSFFLPFLGCAAAAHYVLGWDAMPSWLAGVAMSTTSVAVVYAVMIEYGLNTTEYGKTVLAACFITDLGTVLALGLIFAPFTMKTLIFLAVGVAVFLLLPWLTPRFFRIYGSRPSERQRSLEPNPRFHRPFPVKQSAVPRTAIPRVPSGGRPGVCYNRVAHTAPSQLG